MADVAIPARVVLDAVTEGDTWQGFSTDPITFDGEAWPEDLALVRMKVRRRDTGSVVLSFSSAGGSGVLPITITDAATWEITVPQVEKEDLTLTAGVHEWDLDVTDAAGYRLTLYHGTWEILEKID